MGSFLGVHFISLTDLSTDERYGVQMHRPIIQIPPEEPMALHCELQVKLSQLVRGERTMLFLSDRPVDLYLQKEKVPK